MTTEAESPHVCPICLVAFKATDICATDITEGTCHAACLEGSPVVDLHTGEPTGGQADTYLYGEPSAPPAPAMSDTETKLREALDGVTAQLHLLLDGSHRRQPDIDIITQSYSQDWHLKRVPQIKCADGFTMSVQASAFHYCAPRDSEGPWNAVEVGFPTARVDAFMPYIDGDETTDPTDTVYGYVPIGIVAQVIVDHGGFDRSLATLTGGKAE